MRQETSKIQDKLVYEVSAIHVVAKNATSNNRDAIDQKSSHPNRPARYRYCSLKVVVKNTSGCKTTSMTLNEDREEVSSG